MNEFIIYCTDEIISISEAYNKPIIFTTSSPSKTSTSTKKNGVATIGLRNPISNSNSKTPIEMRPCQRIIAGVLCEDAIDYPL